MDGQMGETNNCWQLRLNLPSFLGNGDRCIRGTGGSLTGERPVTRVVERAQSQAQASLRGGAMEFRQNQSMQAIHGTSRVIDSLCLS